MDEKWIVVPLGEDERAALSAMARAECRTLARQLAWLARQEAERRGLLPDDPHAGDAGQGVSNDRQ